ncbi:ADP/ATP translocase 3-like [Ptychodera flava]|uniref:ADP/ATP translocase 3-like n=1 Tax=Ptychodera flava TaxID=63121 RepID=UPI003969C108
MRPTTGEQIIALGAVGISVAVSQTILAPIERIKILLQAQDAHPAITKSTRYRGIINCFARVTTEQGVLSLWRGNIVSLVTIFPSQALNFAFKYKFGKLFVAGIDKKTEFRRFFLANVLSGGVAGATTLCVIYPLAFARTRLATDIGRVRSEREFRGSIDCFRKIFSSDGFRGLYRGFSVSILGIIVYRSAYFGLFDTAKSFVPAEHQRNLAVSFAIAQFVTLCSGLIAYPFDTVRCRMMMQSGREKVIYRNTIDCWKKIYINEGGKGYYKGALTSILRGVGGALMLVVYDLVK